MKISDTPNIRMINQHISGNKLDTPKDLLSQMGAIQAQDYAMSKWAIGLRIKNATEQQLNQAIDEGEILRTHLLRPTWHFVAAEDLNWIRKLTAPAIKASMKTRNRELELSNEVFKKSHKVIKAALKGSNTLTREELTFLLNKANIRTDNNRASHIFMEAELDGIICSGRTKGNKLTYALIGDRVRKSISISNDEAIKKLAHIYFASRGPAELDDFAWWSGLTKSIIKNALALSDTDTSRHKLDSLWSKHSPSQTDTPKNSVYLLPAFDEYMISYKDRSAIILFVDHRKTISSNGIFHPLIVENGIIIGVWKRTIRKDKILVEAETFKPLNKKIKEYIEIEAIRYGNFLGKDVELNAIRKVESV
jgi:hypothetical protein